MTSHQASSGSAGPRPEPKDARAPRGLLYLFITLFYAAAVILTAPYMGSLRDIVQARYPEHHVAIFKAIVGVGLLIVVCLVVRLLMTHTLRRMAGLIIIAVLVAVQITLTNTPYPQINWIERIHFFEYALMSVLFWRAFCGLFPGLTSNLSAVLATGWTGILDEFVQWIVPGRVGDIRDVELNFVCGLIGQLFVLLVLRSTKSEIRLSRRFAPALLVITAGSVAGVAVFFDVVHIGYVIEDPGIGTFRSRYTSHELQRLAHRRSESGAVVDARAKIRSGRKFRVRDFYLSEGVAHVASRNRYNIYDKDMVKAAKEQAIIERYYPALLAVKEDTTRLDAMIEQAKLTQDLSTIPFKSEQFKDVLFTQSRLYLWLPVTLLLLALLSTALIIYRGPSRKAAF